MTRRRGRSPEVLISYRCLTVKDGRRCPGEVERIQDGCPLCGEPVILAVTGDDAKQLKADASPPPESGARAT